MRVSYNGYYDCLPSSRRGFGSLYSLQSADWVARAREVELAKIVWERVPLPKRESQSFMAIR